MTVPLNVQRHKRAAMSLAYLSAAANCLHLARKSARDEEWSDEIKGAEFLVHTLMRKGQHRCDIVKP